MCEGLVAVTQNKPGKCWQPLPELAGRSGVLRGKGRGCPVAMGGHPGCDAHQLPLKWGFPAGRCLAGPVERGKALRDGA